MALKYFVSQNSKKNSFSNTFEFNVEATKGDSRCIEIVKGSGNGVIVSKQNLIPCLANNGENGVGGNKKDSFNGVSEVLQEIKAIVAT